MRLTYVALQSVLLRPELMQTTVAAGIEMDDVARQTRFSFFGVPSLQFVTTNPFPTSFFCSFSGVLLPSMI